MRWKGKGRGKMPGRGLRFSPCPPKVGVYDVFLTSKDGKKQFLGQVFKIVPKRFNGRWSHSAEKRNDHRPLRTRLEAAKVLLQNFFDRREVEKWEWM